MARLFSCVVLCLALLSTGCDPSQFPGPQTPRVVRVLQPGNPPSPIAPAAGAYAVAAQSGVLLDVAIPWPATLEVHLDGRRLDGVSDARASELQQADETYFLESGGAEERRILVFPSKATRTGPGYRLELVMVSQNTSLPDDQRRSAPAVVTVRNDESIEQPRVVNARFHGGTTGVHVLEKEGQRPRVFRLKGIEFDVRLTYGARSIEFVGLDHKEPVKNDKGEVTGHVTVKQIAGGTGRLEFAGLEAGRWTAGDVTLDITLNVDSGNAIIGGADAPLELTTGTVGTAGSWDECTGTPLRPDWDVVTNPSQREFALCGLTTLKGSRALGGKQAKVFLQGDLRLTG